MSVKKHLRGIAVFAAASAVGTMAALAPAGTAMAGTVSLGSPSSTGSLGPAAPGSAITQQQMVARAHDWISNAVPYSQSAGWQDGATGGPYREDCSGFVSMAWGLTDSLVTQTLPNVSTVTASNISGDTGLQPGDALDYTADHVVLFDSWANQSTGTFNYDAEHTYGQVANETQGSIYSSTLEGYSISDFEALRYNNIQPAAPTNVQLDIVGGDGAMYSQYGNFTAGRFNPSWTNVGGASITKITSVNVGGDLVHYYAIAGGRIYGQDLIPSTDQWSGWQQLPGDASGAQDISAALTGDNVIVSIIGGDGGLWTQYGNYDAGHFDAGWTKRDGASLTSISTIAGDSNSIHVFAVGAGGRVYGEDIKISTNSTTGWAEIPGNATSVEDIATARTGNNVIVTIIGGDGVLYTQYANFDAGHFDASWTQRDGSGLTHVSTVAVNDNLIYVYAIGAGGRVYGQNFTVNTNSMTTPLAEVTGNASSAQDITASLSN